MGNSYYSPSAILLDSLKIPTTFPLPLPHCGILDDQPADSTLPANIPISLPLYLATLLAVQRVSSDSDTALCTLDLPACIGGAKAVNALRADPRVVDLRALCGDWFGFAGKVLELWDLDADGSEDNDLAELVKRVFRTRAAEVADWAHGDIGGASAGAGGGDFLRRLDDTELQLFKAAREGSRAMREWLGEVKRKG